MAARRSDGGVPVVCFSCGQPGHHIRDCPNKSGAPAAGAGGVVASRPVAAASAVSAGGAAGAAPSDVPIQLGHSIADAQKRIKQLLIMLTPDYASLTQLSAALMEDLRAHGLHDFLAQTLLNCVRCLPQKSMIFVGLCAALRIHMHKEGPDGSYAPGTKAAPRAPNATTGIDNGVPLVAEGPDRFLSHFLSLLADAVLEACHNGAWDELRLMLRFTAGLGLANIVPMDAVWDAVERVYALLTAEGEGGVDAAALLPTSQREYLLYMLLSLVPFLAEAFDDPRFSLLTGRLQALVAARRRDGPAASGKDLLSVTVRKVGAAGASAEDSKMSDDDQGSSSNSSSGQHAVGATSTTIVDNFCFDLLDCWSATLANLTSSGSKDAFLTDASEVSIQRSSYQLFRVEQDNLCKKPLDFPVAQLVTLPAGTAPRLRPILRLFPRSPRVTAGSIMPLNDLLIGDYISDLLSIFVALHKECTKQLLSLPLPLSDAARRNGQYLLVETLFENILTLPRPNVLPLYYGTIFIDLFKAQPNLLPPLLGTAVNALFHRLPSLDLELTERLLDWFSFHLSNFGYVWPWLSWNYVLGLADTAPQRVFVSKALALCVRLSYWERIQQVIPEEFLPLMPPQPHPAFRFSARNVESAAGDLNIQQYHALANDLLKLLHNKAPTNTIIGWLDAQVTPVLGSEARLRLFTPCLLESGNKSYSHMIALLERYRTVFQVLCSTTTKRRPAGEDPAAAGAATPELLSSFDCQRLIVHSLSEYWQHSVQHLIVLSEQLLVCGVISIQSVVAWVFFAQRHPERMTHLWKDILFASLRRALVQLQKQVDAVLHKPRAMAAAQTADRRAEDARQIEALHLERRELLVQCVANFQRLLADQLARRDAAAAAAQKVRESDRERIEEDIRLIIQRFLHFARVFHVELAGVLPFLHEVVPKTSPLSDLVSQIPAIL